MGIENKSAWEQAEEHIARYVTDEFEEAWLHLQKESSGDGCGCWQCLHFVCHQMNNLTDWIAGDDWDGYPHFRVNPKTREIEQYFPNCE